jgi:hypothetical protein
MRRRISIAAGVIVAVVIVAAVAVYLVRPGMLPTLDEPKQNATTEIITRGEYLARAGDCIACHTEPNEPAFAGGRAMPTPFGNLYSPNITPDDDTGIGLWTAN